MTTRDVPVDRSIEAVRVDGGATFALIDLDEGLVTTTWPLGTSQTEPT